MSTSIQLALILPAMTRVDLNEDQRELLVHTLRDIIPADRFPLSLRIRCLREDPCQDRAAARPGRRAVPAAEAPGRAQPALGKRRR
jgi:hypothetical protein